MGSLGSGIDPKPYTLKKSKKLAAARQDPGKIGPAPGCMQILHGPVLGSCKVHI